MTNKDKILFESMYWEIHAEGLDECMRSSKWKIVEDDKFQRLKKEYIQAAYELETYIADQVESFESCLDCDSEVQ